jgi:hypothetical protein
MITFSAESYLSVYQAIVGLAKDVKANAYHEAKLATSCRQ